jgi:NADPH-dependent L-lysine 6-monooxygenase-like protein
VPDPTIHAPHVVVATGPFQRPRIPQLAEGVARSVLQTDPTRYRRPENLPDGAVLVVGSGASGCQIGDELLRAGRTVLLSVSRHRRDSFPGRQWPPSTVVTGVSGGYDVNVRQMAADGVRVLGRVIGASDGTLAVASNANEVLDEADAAFAGFVAAAHEFAAANPDVGVAEEEPTGSRALPATVHELESLNLRSRERNGDRLGDWLRLRLRVELARTSWSNEHSYCMGTYVRACTTPRARSVLTRYRTTRTLVSGRRSTRTPDLPLEDALQLVHLYAERGSPKYERAALRWLQRYLDEHSPRLRHFAEIATDPAARESRSRSASTSLLASPLVHPLRGLVELAALLVIPFHVAPCESTPQTPEPGVLPSRYLDDL